MLEVETKEIMNVGEVKLKRKTKFPQGLKLDDLPKDLQEAIGLPEGGKSLSDIIEADPKVQELMQKQLAVVEGCEIEVVPGYDGKSGNSNNGNSFMGVPRELIKKRNDKIIDWYTMGIGFRTILHNINTLEKKYNRGLIETEKSIRKIVADYYTSIRPAADEVNVFDDAMREAAYAAHEQAIEKLARVVMDKPMDKRKSTFEYAIVLEKIIQSHQLKIENRGWNRTRANPIAALQQNNQINIINQNVDNYATKSIKEESVQKLISELDIILEGE